MRRFLELSAPLGIVVALVSVFYLVAVASGSIVSIWTPTPISEDLDRQADAVIAEMQAIGLESARLEAHKAALVVTQTEFLMKARAEQGAPVTAIFDWSTKTFRPAKPEAAK